MTRLDDTQIRQRLVALPQWTCTLREGTGGIERDFRFANFVQAFGFMTEVAALAERHDHHPEWSNVYSKVHIRFTTHDEGGLTELDFEMAAACEAAALRLRPAP